MAQRTHSLALDAAALEAQGQLAGVAWDAAANRIALDDRVLVEDDAPAIGRPEGATDEAWFERLVRGVRIRKELVLDDGRAAAAWLTWCGRERDGNDVPLHIAANGVEVLRPPSKHAAPQCRHYYTSDWGGSHFDNWFVVALPAGALRAGVNAIDLWADAGEPGWEVMVAADSELARGSSPPRARADRSAKSRDGGVTWDRQRLGWKDEIDGEYCVRLSLDRYRREGVFRSAAIDVAGQEGGIRRRLALVSCQAAWDVDLPPETGVAVRVHFGDDPRPEGEGWTAWQGLDGLEGRWEAPLGRWLQFEATLTTADPLVTPALRGVALTAQVEDPTAGAAPRSRLAHLRNGRAVHPSAPYTWEDPEALRALRARFELDRVVAGAATQFEAMLRLMNWSYRIPLGQLDPYAWRYDDLPQLERDADGAIRQLGPYDGPRRPGHCLYCNLTLIAALTAFGYPARWVNISTKHTYGHEVTEAWSNDFGKWVFLDATRDYYIYDAETGVPLSLAEIGTRVGAVLPEPVTWDRPIQAQLPAGVGPGTVRVAYRTPAHGGPVFAAGASHDLLMIGHLQMPLRNDFASRPHPVPWRVSSNWGSSEFYCWTSERFPRKREYDRHTGRRQDWEPALNEAQLCLRESADSRVLRVDVDTVTPWLDRFEARVDDGAWQERPAQWDWPLHEGLNRLRVRVRNRAGVRGPESEAAVVVSG